MRTLPIPITRTRAVILGGALALLLYVFLVTSEAADIQSSVRDLVTTINRVVVMPSGAEPSAASIASMRSNAATVLAASMTADLATEVMTSYDPYLSALEKGETRAFATDVTFSDWTFTVVSLEKGVAHAEGIVHRCVPSIDYAETPRATWNPCGVDEFAVTLVRRDGRWVLSQYQMDPMQAP